jgi:hypothetical protein
MRPHLCGKRRTQRVSSLARHGTPLAACIDAGPHARAAEAEEANMLWTIFVILGVLWFAGMLTSYTMGGFIHFLLAAAIILAVLNLLQGRRIFN